MEDISSTYTEQDASKQTSPDDLIVNLGEFEGPLDLLLTLATVSYTHLTLPTNREV